jgi:hypothetical protein
MNTSQKSLITSNADSSPPSENAHNVTAKECEKICNEMLKCIQPMGKDGKPSAEKKKKPYEPLTGVVEYFIFWN